MRTIVTNSILKYSKKLNFEEFQSAMYSVKHSLAILGQTGDLKFKQFELDLFKDLQATATKSKNVKLLVERVFFLDSNYKSNTDAIALQKELQTVFLELYNRQPGLINKRDAAALLIKGYARVQDPKETSREIIETIVDKTFGSEEQLKHTPSHVMMDLLTFLQRPSRRISFLREKLMPQLIEKMKNVSTNVLETYIRRIINLEDTTPINTIISIVQAKNIFEFLEH